jgi:glycosyltransferase involved in cell wall biosynthesis
MKYPRVLIFGQPFNDFSGGGITLTNLFKGWPKSKIAVTFIGHGLFNVTTDVCDTYYQLGRMEHKWIFPFNMIQRKFKSGIKIFEPGASQLPINHFQAGFRYKIVNKFFYPVLRWLGFFHSISKITISSLFKDWLLEYQPDILYLQASTRETILFALDLCDFLKKPTVIHVMDDWPSTISSSGLFKKYWKVKIDKEFRQLLDKVSLHISISEPMSVEYLKRYGKEFVPFHNPIDTDRWLKHSKTNFEIDQGNIKILYSGRLGDHGIDESLFEVASAIDMIEDKNINIRLHIQTPSNNLGTLNRLRNFKCVVINPFVSYDQLPGVFADSDLLLLPNDFTLKGVDYLRYSMPTKAPEYMISGSPVLIYASAETAISQFFSLNYCGFCVTKQDLGELRRAILFLIGNKELRMELSRNAVNLAKQKFNSDKVRSDFQGLLIDLEKN